MAVAGTTELRRGGGVDGLRALIVVCDRQRVERVVGEPARVRPWRLICGLRLVVRGEHCRLWMFVGGRRAAWEGPALRC